MIKSTTKKTTKKKASSKKANPGKDWIRHADLRPKGGGRNSDEHKYSDEKSNQEYYVKLHKLAEDIQWEKRNEYPIHGYPQWRALEDAAEILAKKKQNPSKKCRTIKVRRKISMGKGKRPRILQVRRKVCNPNFDKTVSPEKRTKILNDLNNLEGKKIKIFDVDGVLAITGTLYETPTDIYGRGFEVAPMYEDPYLYKLHFDLDDVDSVKNKNIYLRSIVHHAGPGRET